MKRRILITVSLVLMLLAHFNAKSQIRPFVTTWTTTTSPETISIPLNGGFTYDFTYVWKNASDSSEVISGTHTSADGAFATELPTAGSFLLEITGNFPHLQRGYPIASLTDVNQWGDIVWRSFNQTFRNWAGVSFSATDVPDLSNTTTTFQMFFDARSFSSDLSAWDVSNIQDMRDMFRGARAFDSDISGWNISNATSISQMFAGAQNFNADLSSWVINENVTSLSGMFRGAFRFTSNLNGWDVSNITSMFQMFRQARAFNSDLDNWNVSNVTNMQGMFDDAEAFNGDIGNWDVGNVTNMRDMFFNTNTFNRELNQWNVENVTNMQGMFANALAFNSDLNDWNVGNVRNMLSMFRNARAFNGNIGDWNVGSVTNMANMFRETRNFDQDIGNWDVSNVTNMSLMFRGTNAGTPTIFNQDISDWDVRKVTDMSDMFLDSRFNQDISSWTLEATTNMRRMFFRAQDFNQNLGAWAIPQVTNMDEMFNGSGLTPQNYDQTLIGWAPQVDDSTPDIAFGASELTFCKSATARQSLIDNGWTIDDANTQVCLDETDFVSFKISQFQATDEVINTTDHTITLSVIQSANVTDLTPIITLSPGATAIPASNTVQDFTSPIIYTVTAENGITTQDWTVTVTQETVALTETDILTFNLTENSAGSDSIVSIDLDEVNHLITLNLIPFGSLADITPEFTISQGATVNSISGEAIDMSTGSFTYTVTAEDGTTAQDWIVNTNVLPSEETDITVFSIPGQIGETEINSNLHRITLKYPFVLGIDELTPTVEVSREATIDPLSGAARDFTLSGTNSIEYTVTAQDGTTTQIWTATLIPASTETDIVSFELDNSEVEDVTIDADAHTIELTLEPFAELINITPEITISDNATVSPESDEEIAFNNGPFTYTVTAEDGITTQDWIVSANVLLSEETDFESFGLSGQVGESFIDLNNHTIFIFFNAGDDLTALTPSFEISRAASVTPGSGQVQDFSTDVIYTIIAQDGVTTQDWTVSAIIQRPFITSWNSLGGELNISINERENYDFNFIWRNSNGQIVAFGRHNSDEDFITDLASGEFTLEITGTFPHFTGYPKDQLIDVNQWGDIKWISMRESFRNWTGNDFSATDTPDLSQGPDMFRAFSDNPNFNADLSDWDMSQIRTLQGLFNTCPSFNSDISNWNVGNVTNMESTFVGSGFNGDISEWNVSNVTRMVNTFRDATNFDQDISGLDFSKVTNMSNMLSNSGMSVQHYDKFLISLATQDVRNDVTLGALGLSRCLSNAAKEQLEEINNWTIDDSGELCSSETDIITFEIPGAQISDAVIDNANHTVSAIILNSAELTELAPEITISAGASINPISRVIQDFTDPVVYEVVSSDSTTQDWTVTVTNAASLSDETDILTFDSQSNQVEETTIDNVNHEIILRLISEGVLTSITPELTVSLGATISPASGGTIDLTSGSATYTVTAEDQTTTQDWTISVILNNDTDISGFNLTGVLSSVKIDPDVHTVDILVAEGSDVTSLLTEVTVQGGASISPLAITVQDFTNPVTYTVTAEDGVTTQDWVVTVQLVQPFITSWQPELDEDEEDDFFLFLEFNSDFDYDFSYQWKDENGVVLEIGSLTTDDEQLFSTFPNENEVTLEIIGEFPHFIGYFEPTLLDVIQWGDIEWRSFESSFRDWPGVAFSAEDVPNLSQVTTMHRMFQNTTSFNGDVSEWNIENVMDMSFMFTQASSFKGDLSQWNVENVTNMNRMFNLATAFNGDLSQWKVGKVTDMFRMFRGTSFNSDISGWDIGKVTNMGEMFNESALSTQFYDRILIDWAAQEVQTGVTLGASGIGHCFGADAVTELETNSEWTINDEGAICSSENDILAIDIPGLEVGNEVIDVASHTAEVTVLNSADLTGLSPEYTLSDGAIFSATSVQSGQTADFSNPVVYEILSSDSTFQMWTVTIVNAATASSDTDILTFTPDTGSNVNINNDTHEVSFDAAIPSEFLVTPDFTLSQGATSTPGSGEEIDLSDANETYLVTAEDGTTTQEWTVTVNDLTPENDLCSNAIEVFVNSVVTGNTTFATSDASIAPDCGSNNTGLGVWYRIVGNGETITLNTCSPNSFSDTSLSLFTGSCDNGLICVAGNDDAGIPGECGGSGFQSRLGFNSEVGEEYLILLDGFSNAIGEFELAITSEPTPELPANDDCETAEVLTVFAQGEGTPTNGNNTSAALFSGEVNCDIFGSINDVWYTFNSGPNVRVGITLAGVDTDDDGPLTAARDFRLAAYEECGGNTTICDQNANGQTNLDVTPNTDYRLQIWNDDVEDEGTFTIIVNDGPNTPAVLSFDNAGVGSLSISRTTESGVVIDSLIAEDPQGHSQVTSLISGNDESIFAYNDNSRKLTIANAAALQASSTTAFDLTFRSADQGPGELNSEITLTIDIIDNAPPVFNLTEFVVDENTTNGSVLGSLSVSDPDGDVVNIVGFNSQDGAFAVNPLTRDLIVADAAQLDFETKNRFFLEVTIEDNAVASLQATETIAIDLNDINEAPVVTGTTLIISDQSSNGTVIGTVSFDDQDEGQSYSFEITNSDASDIFIIDENTGEISIANSLLLADNGAGTYNLTIEVSDNGSPNLSGSNAITVEVTTNNSPIISTNILPVDENSPVGTFIGQVEASDADGDQITLSLENNGSSIDFLLTQDGQLFVGAEADLDFENTPAIEIEVAATDNGDGNLRTLKTITVQLNDLNESPSLNNRDIDIASSLESGTIIGTLQGQDPENDQLSYSITAGNELGVFAIDESTGELLVESPGLIDPISTPRFTLTVEVSDGEFSDAAEITIDIFSNPDSPVFTSVSTFSINENAESGALIGTVVAEDNDGISRYSIISGNEENLFRIGSNSGELEVDNGVTIDFEQNQQFVIEVSAADDGLGNVESIQQITININDVNEFNPVITNVTGNAIDENSSSGTLAGNVEATDADLFQTLSYEIISGNDDGLFEIDGNGQITTTTGIDFEEQAVYTLTIEVSDDVETVRTTTDEVTITINNVNEAPVIEQISEQSTIAESELTFTVNANDPENDEISFSISENSQIDGMELGASTGTFSWTPSRDQLGTFEITLEATDGEFTSSETVTINVINDATDILSFILEQQTIDAEINLEDHTVVAEVEFGTDVSSLAPTFTLSDEAVSNINSGDTIDFTNPVTLTVTAQSGSNQDWVITVTDAPNTATDILSFELDEQTEDAIINSEDHTVALEVGFGTDLTNLNPSFNLSFGATSDPESGVSIDFTEDVTISVTAEDEETNQDWVVTVSEALNTETDIISFTVPEQTGEADIDFTNHTVQVEVEFGTDLTELVPTFVVSEGASSNPESGNVIDFSDEVAILVTAQNGIDTQDWTIEVSEALSPETDILSFELPEQTGAAEIDFDEHSINITVVRGTDFTELVPTFSLSNGATSNPESGVALDFTNEVIISVSAENGIDLQDWSINVFEELNNETDILSFEFNEQTGPASIDAVNHTVEIEVEFGTSINDLIPIFTISESATSDPQSGANVDFTDLVVITVIAENGVTTQDWTVTVNIDSETPDTETDILSFLLDEQTGNAIIDTENHSISIEVDFGTDLTNLIPTFTLSEGATSNPESGSSFDFSSTGIITVTAEDGVTTQEWTISVSEDGEDPDTDTDILSFVVEEQINEAIIDLNDHTVSIIVASGTDLTGLSPVFTLSEGATSDPVSGSLIDFTNPVIISVEAEDQTTTQDWTVDVKEFNENASDETDILSFVLAEQSQNAVINDVDHTIEIPVEFGTNLANLVAFFTLSDGASSDPESGTNIDFGSSVLIIVTAENGVDTQEWQVVVSVDEAPGTGTDIIEFAFGGQAEEVEINAVTHTIEATVEFGTDITNLTPLFALSEGATSNPPSGTTIDFTNDVIITVTAEDGITNQNWTIRVEEGQNPLNVEEEIQLNIYPNPVINMLEISTEVEVSITLTDINGKLQLKPITTRLFQIDMSGYPEGMYLLTIEFDGRVITKKIIKQ
ncbi:MAG: BspA family leucine-rich repeat surface protein [bacterium]|nr:BspA family leucine-rich repeat surface protein [bacterium]